MLGYFDFRLGIKSTVRRSKSRTSYFSRPEFFLILCSVFLFIGIPDNTALLRAGEPEAPATGPRARVPARAAPAAHGPDGRRADGPLRRRAAGPADAGAVLLRRSGGPVIVSVVPATTTNSKEQIR